MRRIVSKEREEQIRKRNQVLVGGILIALMLLSTAGFAFFYKDPTESEIKINFNEYEFAYRSGYWITEIGSLIFIFKNNPHQTPNITYRGDLTLSNFYDQPLYVYSEDDLATEEIKNNLGQLAKGGGIQRSTLPGENSSEFQDCEQNFIIIKNSSDKKFLQENKCIYIYAPQKEVISATDEFLFRLFGIK